MATINSIDSTINSTTSGIALSSSTGLLSSSATTNHAIQLGNGTGTLSSLGVGSSNTALLGNTGADPSFGTITNAMLSNSTIGFNSPNGAGAAGMYLNGGSSTSVSLGSTITLNGFGDGVFWRVNAALNIPFSNWGHFNSANAGLSTTNLVTTMAVGDVYYMIWIATGATVRVNPGAAARIFINGTGTTAGTGFISPTTLGASITLVCTAANTTWWAFDISGTWTVT